VHHGEADADTAGDLAQRLALVAAGEDRSAFVLVDHPGSPTLTSAPRGGFQAAAGLAGDVATAVLGQRQREVEDQPKRGSAAARSKVRSSSRT
jgi:hypothetical protein